MSTRYCPSCRAEQPPPDDSDEAEIMPASDWILRTEREEFEEGVRIRQEAELAAKKLRGEAKLFIRPLTQAVAKGNPWRKVAHGHGKHTIGRIPLTREDLMKAVLAELRSHGYDPSCVTVSAGKAWLDGSMNPNEDTYGITVTRPHRQ